MGIAVCTYCRREDVDFRLVSARVAPKRLTACYLTAAPFIVMWPFAVICHQTTGHPLINAGLGSMFENASGGSSMVIGIGAAAGVLAVISLNSLNRHRKFKQARTEAARAAETEDEN